MTKLPALLARSLTSSLFVLVAMPDETNPKGYRRVIAMETTEGDILADGSYLDGGREVHFSIVDDGPCSALAFEHDVAHIIAETNATIAAIAAGRI